MLIFLETIVLNRIISVQWKIPYFVLETQRVKLLVLFLLPLSLSRVHMA